MTNKKLQKEALEAQRRQASAWRAVQADKWATEQYAYAAKIRTGVLRREWAIAKKTAAAKTVTK